MCSFAHGEVLKSSPREQTLYPDSPISGVAGALHLAAEGWVILCASLVIFNSITHQLYRPVSVTLTMAGVAVASFRICAASLSKSSCVCAPLGLGDGWYWSFTTMPVGDAGDPWVTLLVLPPLLVRGAVPLLPPLDMYKYAIAMRINPNTIATT